MQNKKIKILFICTDPATGMIPYAAKIVNTISENSNIIEVFGFFVSKDRHSYVNYINDNTNSNFFFIEASHNKTYSLIDKIYPIRYIKLINSIIDDNNINIVHCLTTEFSLSHYLSTIQRKVKVIYTVHDLFPHEQKKKNISEKIISWIIRTGVNRNIKNISILSTNSKSQFEFLKKVFPNKTIYLHPFPTLVTFKIKKGSRTCPELIGIKNYILFFGRIELYKGVDLLCEAFLNSDMLKSQYKLVIAGTGTWYFDIDLNKNQNIISINRFVEDDEIKQLFKNASCVVYPYYSATQSGVLSLAYYFGIPLVVSDTDFFLENVKSGITGEIFKKGEVQSLIQSIYIATSLEKKSYLKQIQKELYNSLYSDEILSKTLISTYKTLYF